MLIRQPGVGDADAMGRVHVEAWLAAYRGIMPDEYLDGLQSETRAAMWRERIESTGGEGLLVAVVDDRTVGFSAFGPCREDRGLGEVHAVNVHPHSWGRGAGRGLLRAATAQLRVDGFAELVLWVAPENPRARRLYESEGWVADGRSRVQEVLGVTVDEVAYRR